VETKILGILARATASLESLIAGSSRALQPGNGNGNTVFFTENKAKIALDKVKRAIKALEAWVESGETEIDYLENAKGQVNAAVKSFCNPEELNLVCTDLDLALGFLEEEFVLLQV